MKMLEFERKEFRFLLEDDAEELICFFGFSGDNLSVECPEMIVKAERLPRKLHFVIADNFEDDPGEVMYQGQEAELLRVRLDAEFDAQKRVINLTMEGKFRFQQDDFWFRESGQVPVPLHNYWQISAENYGELMGMEDSPTSWETLASYLDSFNENRKMVWLHDARDETALICLGQKGDFILQLNDFKGCATGDKGSFILYQEKESQKVVLPDIDNHGLHLEIHSDELFSRLEVKKVFKDFFYQKELPTWVKTRSGHYV